MEVPTHLAWKSYFLLPLLDLAVFPAGMRPAPWASPVNQGRPDVPTAPLEGILPARPFEFGAQQARDTKKGAPQPPGNRVGAAARVQDLQCAASPADGRDKEHPPGY